MVHNGWKVFVCIGTDHAVNCTPNAPPIESAAILVFVVDKNLGFYLSAFVIKTSCGQEI
jgi:hypothetical protein